MRHLYSGPWLPGVPRGARRVAGLGRGVALADGYDAAPAVDPDAVALVVFTSGTTSDPKAVVHTARTLGGMLGLFRQVGDLRPGQRAHTDQMFLGLPAVLAGGTWEIPARSPKDAPEAFARGVAGADSSFLVPADVTALLDVVEARADAGTGPPSGRPCSPWAPPPSRWRCSNAPAGCFRGRGGSRCTGPPRSCPPR
nr:hypothetical protein GCM10025730_43040 [Promicromonospora thailandica]